MKKQIYHAGILLEHFSVGQVDRILDTLSIVKQLCNINLNELSSIEIMEILLAANVDAETIIAALLADPFLSVTDIYASAEQIKPFSSSISLLVKDVKDLNQLQVYSTAMAQQPRQAETLRRMLLSSVKDVRTVLIKLAYRIYRLRHLSNEDNNFQSFISQETLDIYAPIANRLGVSQLKWELEDLAFRHLQPGTYLNITTSLEVNREQRENIVDSFRQSLHQVIKDENIVVDIKGRSKHIYSIWKKLQRKDMKVDELYDLLAVRILVDNLAECYAVLGIVHGNWQYIPKEFDDYISNPKNNGYQSLHTVILDFDGNRIEVQIRTYAMNEFAEMGVAAHWRYKEGSKQNAATENNITALRQLLIQKESDQELVDNFKTELFYDRVYVLSPEGKLVDLIKGSTPLDFAYVIHTEIGHRCRGAKVNGRIVPLTYQLQSGEQVEILTTKEGEPNPHWIDLNLGYLKSPRTINKIKRWFKQQDDEKNLFNGKVQIEYELQHLDSDKINLNQVAKHFNKLNTDQLYIAIGRGEITAHQLENIFHHSTPYRSSNRKKSENTAKVEILIDGMKNLTSSIAHCCHPVFGDKIVGYISHFKGITIHRTDCKNIIHLNRKQKTQLISVSWSI